MTGSPSEPAGAPGGSAVPAAAAAVAAHDVFISYGSDDAELAHELRRHVEAGGFGVWMAPDDVTGPKTWAEQIVDAITDCRVMLVLVSSVANRSTHVSKEVELALEHGKAVLPVRLEDVAPSGALRYLLALAQWIDAFPGPLGPHAEEVRRRVGALIGPAVPRAGPPVPARPPAPPPVRPPRAWKRWALVAGIVAVVATGAGVATWALTREEAPPYTYGDDARLDGLWDDCAGEDFAACTVLYRDAPTASEYEEFGATCGWVGVWGDCTGTNGGEPDDYGDDAYFDSLWDRCAVGETAACLTLYRESPVNSTYEEFGATCGWVGAWGDCTGEDDWRPDGYGDDAYLDSLWDGCAAGDVTSCTDLFLEAPVGSTYEQFGATCGYTAGWGECLLGDG